MKSTQKEWDTIHGSQYDAEMKSQSELYDYDFDHSEHHNDEFMDRLFWTIGETDTRIRSLESYLREAKRTYQSMINGETITSEHKTRLRSLYMHAFDK